MIALRRDVAGHVGQGTRLAGPWLSFRVTTTTRRFGAQSMTSPLREVLVQRPGAAFGAAFEDPAHGFLHPVDLAVAQREHDAFVELLASLGPTRPRARQRPDEPGPRLPVRSAARHRPRRDPAATGQAEPAGRSPRRIEAWTRAAGIQTLGRIEAPGTIEGGDTFWLRPDLLCIGRTLRTNDDGARQLAALVGGDVRVFDVPYWRGPAELIHLLSVISPIADDLAVVFLPLLPVGPVAAAERPRDPPARGPRRRIPDARLQRAGGPARGRHPRRGQPGDRAGHGRCRLRRPHVRGDRDRRQRLRRSDLPDPADPARLTVSRPLPAGRLAGGGRARSAR